MRVLSVVVELVVFVCYVTSTYHSENPGYTNTSMTVGQSLSKKVISALP